MATETESMLCCLRHCLCRKNLRLWRASYDHVKILHSHKTLPSNTELLGFNLIDLVACDKIMMYLPTVYLN